jgi:hypothetical protein
MHPENDTAWKHKFIPQGGMLIKGQPGLFCAYQAVFFWLLMLATFF